MNKEDSYKEKFRQALISTVKVISEDYKIKKEKMKVQKYKFFELDNLTNKHDFIRFRAEADSGGIKKIFK